MKIGFIGLGYLGKTIARRLISEGVELIVWNRTKGKASDLDAETADTPAELIAQVDLLFLNLFDSNAVKSVVFGKDGLTQANVSEKIIIDTTTNHFEDVLYIHETLREYGAYYLESPVLGSVVPASQGNLTVLVSGDHDAFDKARPYIEKIGKTIFYLEKPSLATKMKLINNLLLGAFMATIAEATVFGEIAGVDRETALNIFSAGAGNSMVLNAKREKLLKEDYSTHFSSALIYKDLHYLQDLAKSMKRPLFTGSTIKEIFAMTFKENLEYLDISAVYKVLKEI